MARPRKRAPGGGRKPNPNKKVMFSTRLEPEVLAALKAGAKTWPGENLSTFAEHLIYKGLQEREEDERDPALRALLHMIANLADRMSGMRSITPQGIRPQTRTRWRTDLFQFRAFKVAVRELLDVIEEPRATTPLTKEFRRKRAEEFINRSRRSPEDKKFFVDVHESPEKFGSHQFSNLWRTATEAAPPTDRQRELFRKHPELGTVVDREFYGLAQAVRDLQLKPSKTDGENHD